MQPHPRAIEIAVRQAMESPCQKSKRGVVIYASPGAEYPFFNFGFGHNGPPTMINCDGSEACLADCGRRCVHAEMRAHRDAMASKFDISVARGMGLKIHLVHVKAVGGVLVGGGGPSCFTCSREIVDSQLVDLVWLYESAFTSDADAPRSRWVCYSAADFHHKTLQNNGIY